MSELEALYNKYANKDVLYSLIEPLPILVISWKKYNQNTYWEDDMKIAVIGYRGAGKSTLAKK